MRRSRREDRRSEIMSRRTESSAAFSNLSVYTIAKDKLVANVAVQSSGWSNLGDQRFSAADVSDDLKKIFQ